MTGLCRETALSAWARRPSWHCRHMSLGFAASREGRFEAWGAWQAMHFPWATGGWGKAIFAAAATVLWQVKQSPGGGSFSAKGLGGAEGLWQVAQSPFAAGGWAVRLSMPPLLEPWGSWQVMHCLASTG